MKTKFKSFTVGLFAGVSVLSASAWAAPVKVAIIDSGVDYKHQELAGKIWSNPVDVAGNGKDEDRNGKVDDFAGWNFAEKNNQIIDYQYLGTFSKDPYRFFEIQLRGFNGTATQEDRDWLNARRADPAFLAEMQKFGNFVHGTHVAGIAAKDADARVIGMKIIPTEVKKPFAALAQQVEQLKLPAIAAGEPIDRTRDLLIKQLLLQLAKANGKNLEPVGLYAYSTQTKVANCSFGSSVPALSGALGPILSKVIGREATAEELRAYAKYTVEQMIENGRQFTVDANQTFFVIAAGNDGLDNDSLPVYPANLQRRNVITVAATYGLSKLAVFSNYGKNLVQVAAPGVGIESSIPGNESLKVSGTSQAAPFVTRVVAQMYEEKADLSFDQVKAILMGTVDRKDFLVGKVVSEGIVNPARAVYATRLMQSSRSVQDAISAARQAVPDQVENRLSVQADADAGIFLPMPQLLQ